MYINWIIYSNNLFHIIKKGTEDKLFKNSVMLLKKTIISKHDFQNN